MRNLLSAGALSALLGGCATSGENHLYATVRDSAEIRDVTAQKSIPRIVNPTERVLGLAYDFNTDHLFLRIAPRQTIRVIERPSGKILREMPLPADLQTPRSADLAIRSSDRHLFAVHRDGRSVIELTLFGEPIRRIELAGIAAAIDGLAFDQRAGRLLALTESQVRAYDVNGAEIQRIALNAPLNAVSLGYDSDARHFFVPLKSANTVGEFDASGALISTIAFEPGADVTAIDAGARSFVRVF